MDYSKLRDELVSSRNSPRPRTRSVVVEGMSDEQLQALNGSIARSATVVAGAGAGKTRLLTERAVHLLRSGALSERVAVVSFTRRAATEIAERLTTKLGTRSRLPVCGTVHSIALSCLRQAKSEFRVAQDEEVLGVLQALRGELPSDAFEDLTDGELLLLVNRCREEDEFSSLQGLAARRFEELLDSRGLVDFTALMRLCLSLEIARFDHVLVDEAQDLSKLQMAFLAACARPGAKFWYVGDADQSIYSFRGAHQGVMQQLRERCDDQFVLSTNYRSARRIVDGANNVIACNEGRIEVKWKAHRADDGLVSVELFDTAEAELAAVISWVGTRPRGRMVLGRTRALVEALRAQGLPACTVHESKGLEWPEVWVLGCEAALFPHPLAGRNEERRLFYVAMTRARDELVLSMSRSRASSKKGSTQRAPSPFLLEMQGIRS